MHNEIMQRILELVSLWHRHSHMRASSPAVCKRERKEQKMWGRVRTQEARSLGWVVLIFPSWRAETNIFEGREAARRTRRAAAREPASYGGKTKD